MEPTLGPLDPYSPPRSSLEIAQERDAEYREIRKNHIVHEKTLQAVGYLYLASAVAILLIGLAMIIPQIDTSGPVNWEFVAGIAIAVVLWGGLNLFCALVYRSLSPSAFWLGTLTSGLGLLAVPLGTLFHGWVLYLIWSEKGRRVLSKEYASIIRATPEVRYKRQRADWIRLVVLLLIVIALIGFAASYF